MDKGSANMKKILILSYHFPPMNVIASQRALGYANHFKKFGFEPTVVTFQWEKEFSEQFCEKNNFDERTEKENNGLYNLVKLPLFRSKRVKTLSIIEKSFFGRIGVLISWLFGELDTSAHLLNYKIVEKYFLKGHLKDHKYDYILGVFSPHFNLSNAAWAGKKYNIPYTLDFRDLWDNRIIRTNYNPNLTEKIQDKIYGYYWKRWIRKSNFYSITSQPWLEKLETISD